MTERRDVARRSVLRIAGLTVAGGLAGCSGSSDSESSPTDQPPATDGGEPTGTEPTATLDAEPVAVEDGTVSAGELPPYADLLPATEDALLFAVFGTETESGHEIGATPDEPSDPLRFDGLSGAVTGRVLAAFLLSTDFGFRVDRLGIDETERVLSVGGVGVQVFPVDFEGAMADLEDADVSMRFQADDRAVFVGPEDDVFGLTADALVFAGAEQGSGSFDPVDRIRAIVDARTGAERPKHETDDDFAQFLRHAETGGSVAGGYAPNADLETLVGDRASDASPSRVNLVTDGFGAATAGVFRMGLHNGDAHQPARGTLFYPNRDAIDEDALTTTVGAAATNRSYVRDGTTVRVEGSYSWDALSEFETESTFS
ncbi:hypothetical protein [Halorientalis pallida]|uniref:Uncharacterized protein n=1 Tax=Halorientalis pallida TaxID=2479928 RepID=A0A498KVK7_9EURY|nr:hypothetical protein [Halorientalis pallida]RXK49237.1 hypothetical protein EAF64_09965 [Halorientalis pallida]